jgi:hypothetical protein
MTKVIFKTLQIAIATAAIFTSGFLATANTVSASDGCGVGSYFDNNHQACLPCPVGPYGVSICPDTGIIFNENGDLETGNLIALSAVFASGSFVFLGSKFYLTKYEV